MNTYLVSTIVDMMIFLEYTAAELLDEDTAIQATERLASKLQQMPEDDQRQLAKQIVELSASYDYPQRDFVKGLPDALGIR